MAVVLALLDSPAQTLRSAVSSAVGSVCLQCFSADVVAAIEKAEGRAGRNRQEDDADNEEDENEDEADQGENKRSIQEGDDADDDDDVDGDGDEDEEGKPAPSSGAGADKAGSGSAGRDENDEDEESQDRDFLPGSGPACSLPRSARALVTARTRDALLDVLAERVLDAHAFTRSATLKAWASVVEGRALPLARLPRVLTLASGRLLDKASIVRRSACSVLAAMLEGNPFAGSLSAAPFEAGAATATEWLAKHGPAAVRAAIRAQRRHEAMERRTKEGTDEAVREAAAEEDEAAAKEDEAAAAQEVSQGTVPTEEQGKQTSYRQYCRDALAFIRSMQMACQAVAVLARSKTPSDTVAAIEFLRRARAFRVRGAAAALRRSMCLAWSPEQQVRDAVVGTFKAVFLDLEDDAAAEVGLGTAGRAGAGTDGADEEDEEDEDEEATAEEMRRAKADDHAKRVARGLIRLVSTADEDEKASIEEVLQDLGRRGNLRAAPLRMLWEAAVGGAKALSHAAQAEADLHDVIADAWYECAHPAEKAGSADQADDEGDKPPTHDELLAEAARLRPIATQARRACTRRLASARAALALLSMVAGALPAAVDGAGGLARLTIVLAANTEAAASARRANSARAEIIATS